MNHRNDRRTSRRSVLVAVLLLGCLPALASALPTAEISCDTFDPCMEGVCLEDGTCQASPGNNGDSCDTFNSCTVGVCSEGNCVESDAGEGASCETFDPCMQKNGHCAAGVCEAPALSNGAACRADVLGPCLTGVCATIATFTYCASEPKCGDVNACDLNCNPVNGDCGSFPTHICDTPCSTATCTPEGEFGHECSDVQIKPDQATCYDAAVCNGECEAGECMGTGGGSGGSCGDGTVNGAEECDDGDILFASGESCDGGCTLIACGKPTNSSGVPPKASDALFALKAAVDSVTCDPLVCDVNDSGTITAADALLILKKAVGSPVTLNCPEI